MGLFDLLKSKGAGENAYRMHSQGMNLRRQGKYEESEKKLADALVMYDKAYAEGCRVTKVLQGYALLLLRASRYEDARQVLLTASKDKSMSADDRFNLRVDYSIAQWKQGKLDKAIETMELAGGHKKNGTYFTTLGMYLVEQARDTGNFEKAREVVMEGLDYDDEDEGALDNAGQLYMYMAEYAGKMGEKLEAQRLNEEALKYFKKAYDKKPEQVSSTVFYAKLLHEGGKNAEAKDALDHVMNIPFSGMMQVSRETAESLYAEVSK